MTITDLPLEAQECANCYYARQANRFSPNKSTPTKFVWCHRTPPTRSVDGTFLNHVAPVREDAWCGEWRLDPLMHELTQEVEHD